MSFSQKFDEQRRPLSSYTCDDCKVDSAEIKTSPTEYGAPTHYRKCPQCGKQDGPWIRAEYHWSGGYV